MHRPQAAAVVSGGDAQDTRPARSADADARRFRDSVLLDAVDYDFIDGVDAGGEGGLHEAAQGRAVGVVRAGFELLVSAADLAARADDAAGERQDDAGDFAYRG